MHERVHVRRERRAARHGNGRRAVRQDGQLRRAVPVAKRRRRRVHARTVPRRRHRRTDHGRADHHDAQPVNPLNHLADNRPRRSAIEAIRHGNIVHSHHRRAQVGTLRHLNLAAVREREMSRRRQLLHGRSVHLEARVRTVHRQERQGRESRPGRHAHRAVRNVEPSRRRGHCVRQHKHIVGRIRLPLQARRAEELAGEHHRVHLRRAREAELPIVGRGNAMVGVDGIGRLRDRARLEREVGVATVVAHADFKPRLEWAVKSDFDVLVDLIRGDVQRSLLQLRERECIVTVSALVEAGQFPRPFLDERGTSLHCRKAFLKPEVLIGVDERLAVTVEVKAGRGERGTPHLDRRT